MKLKKHNIFEVKKPKTNLDRNIEELYNNLSESQKDYTRLSLLNASLAAFTGTNSYFSYVEGNSDNLTLNVLLALVNGVLLIYNVSKVIQLFKEKKEIKDIYELKKEVQEILQENFGLTDEEIAKIEQNSIEENENEIEI